MWTSEKDGVGKEEEEGRVEGLIQMNLIAMIRKKFEQNTKCQQMGIWLENWVSMTDQPLCASIPFENLLFHNLPLTAKEDLHWASLVT